MENQQNEGKKSKNKGVLILLVLILIALVIGCILLINLLSEDDTGTGGVGLVVDKSAGEFVSPERENSNQKGVSIPGWGEIKIPANTKNVAVDFFNP